jgi:DNA-3-methyladenine glycosylase II
VSAAEAKAEADTGAAEEAETRAAERVAAHEGLAAADPAMGRLIAAHGPLDPFEWARSPVPDGDLFDVLTVHIVGQLISRDAAFAVYGRMREAAGGVASAEALAALGPDALRATGLSWAKARTIDGLATKVAAGEVDLEALRSLDDREAEATLVALPGIGPWSANMLLLRGLRRPDAFPAGDIGVRKGIALLDARELPSVAEARARAEAWAPYRSYAVAHLWRSLIA